MSARRKQAKPAPLSDLHVSLGEIERTVDPAYVNTIANDPSVYPWVKGWAEGEIDLASVVRSPRNVLLRGAHGAILFVCLQPGLYDVHVQALPEGRGAWMLRFTQACLHYLFTRTDAVELLGRVPKGNIATRTLARSVGGHVVFRNASGWAENGTAVYADILSLTIQDWMAKAPGLVERGLWALDKLQGEYQRHGRKRLLPSDEGNARQVGASIEMILGGRMEKGAVFWRRWASMADRAPIMIVSVDPCTIDMGDALVILKEDELWMPTMRET